MLAGGALWVAASALHVLLVPGGGLDGLFELPLFWALATAPLLVGAMGWLLGDRRREREEAFELYQRAVDEQLAGLAEREWVTRAVVQNAFDAVLILDPSLQVLDANPAAARIFGHTLDALVTQHIEALLPDHDRLERATVVERRTAGGERLGVEWRTRARHADGSLFPVDLHISMLADAGILVYAVREASTRVMREERLVQEALDAQKGREVIEQRRRGSLLQDLGGALRVHLDRVLAQAEELEADGVGTESVGEIVDASHGILERLEELWNLVMWERSQTATTLLPVTVAEVLDGIAEAMEPIARRQRVRLVISLADDLGPVVCDPSLFSWALRNLVRGAVQRGADGEVRIDVAREPGRGTDWVAVFVHDDGPPLDPDTLDRVYLSFATAEAPVVPPEARTGVALAQRLARALGGHVAVDSAEGRGTTFSLRVPMDPTRVREVPTRPPARMDSPPPTS